MSFRHVGDDLQQLLTEWLENPEARRLLLARTWERALGSEVAKRSRPLGYEDGLLTVEVTDASWAAELEAMGGELTRKLNTALGKTYVRRIVWQVKSESN